MIGKIVVFGVLTLAIVVLGHPQYRTLKCNTSDKSIRGGPERAACHMVFKDAELEEPGRPAQDGEGCFTEIHNGEERVYCALVCPEAHTVFNAHIDQGHRACFNFYTYQLEKRDNDWYLWRSGKCLNSTVTFDVGCKFDQPFNEIVPANEIFARLRARALKAL
ncbi:hypothetical protein FO519_004967 [Halicephalobus sp. NKZ332]|nr:hypothetical protein FO519_004967 [Halicephalobus sp. NKZ332]